MHGQDNVYPIQNASLLLKSEPKKVQVTEQL